ncbi:hypothetical protein K431DRAFT_62802 [Polychaeton citri CBS 116435]|uniref:Uncharacterized protein n=1 Tax=Polychaeton citri CBS 116435 TaxID=1314669 RepID=A0A9P4QA21_9PEZI|nr:hypothetical protein K431DRAFT_62802 [Polychaeton citri CBS 116435]
MDLLQGGPAGQSEELDINLISILTRSAITSTYITDPQSRLWTRGFTDCNSTTSSLGEGDPQISPCFHGPSTLMNMSQLIDPFLAHLPSGFDTGLISQHLPRMNSSATREKIADADFPAGCEFLPGAFYVNFNHSGVFDSTSSDGSWSLSACMPANLTLSPWRATRDRQDISEQLYLNISTYSMLSGSTPFVGLYRITLNTTLGYFELPNIFNDHVAGPLLEQSPWKDAAPTNRSVQLPINSGQYRRDLGTAGISNSTLLLGSVVNKGPLLTIAMALFGERSFIASRYENPQAFVANFTTPQAKAEIDAGVNRDLFDELCVEQEPMMALLETNRVANRGTFADALYPGCIRGRSNQISNVHLEVEQWIMAFANGFSQDQIVNAFEAAAFLANQAWLLQSSYNPSMWVSYDPGADTEIPVISKAGIVLISVLLFVYLTAMFSMAWYCSRTPTWTSDLDAFAMMRIGAAMSDQIDFACVEDVDKVRILDETPGWIGDLTEDQGAVGELGLGASMPLTRLREVRCYE